MRLVILVAGAAVMSACSQPDVQAQFDPYDSGGVLMPEQAAYDVYFYDLHLEVNPGDSTIAGELTAHANVAAPLEWFVLDLAPDLDISGATVLTRIGQQPARVDRRGGKLWIELPHTAQPGQSIVASVTYGGRPRVAINAPWTGGFTWATTPSGAPWIATTCQGEGADIWWPVKDHVSDEPDSMAIHVTVPDPLVVASNGRLLQTESTGDGRTTYHWFVSNPINTYGVALNIAPYRLIEGEMQSVAGDFFPVHFYVIPEDYDKGLAFFPEIIQHVRWYEDLLGPYPFRADKYGVAQTPHLGMEHQSIIAYGANFDRERYLLPGDRGFDELHHHELAHEWWGNLVTNADWKDAWIHEGFGTYMQALYAEELLGPAAYFQYMHDIAPRIRNRLPVAPREISSVNEMFEKPHDIYMKGAWVLHTLRYLIGDEPFFEALRLMAYPDDLSGSDNHCRCRFVSTEDFIRIVEDVTGSDLDWFFEIYLRQPKLPRLKVQRKGPDYSLEWITPDGLSFPMPVDVQVGGETRRIEMPGGVTTIKVPDTVLVTPDFRQRILMDRRDR